MDHGVMEDPCHLGLVAPGAIGVEYDVAALEPGLGNLRPMHLRPPTDAMPSSMILPAMVECCPGRRRR